MTAYGDWFQTATPAEIASECGEVAAESLLNDSGAREECTVSGEARSHAEDDKPAEWDGDRRDLIDCLQSGGYRVEGEMRKPADLRGRGYPWTLDAHRPKVKPLSDDDVDKLVRNARQAYGRRLGELWTERAAELDAEETDR